MSLFPSDEELSELIANDTPFIDVRAPVEFTKGSIPGSVNLPVLNDEERAAVGTCYKEQGQEAAIRLGQNLVSGARLSERMNAWIGFVGKRPESWIYCFRGGLRSQSVQQALKESGLDVPLIEGGYKRIRHFLMETIEESCRAEKFIVISGCTGSGKTDLISSSQETAKTCDLELAANHRGSAFGKRGGRTPTQIDFENSIAAQFLKIRSKSKSNTKPHGPIFLEDESRKIGKSEIPAALFSCLSTSPVYVVERPRRERAEYLVGLYLRENYGLQDGTIDEARLALLRVDLEANLKGISRRLGRVELKRFQELVSNALAQQEKTGSFAVHTDWVELLLTHYYDPLYRYHLEKIKDRIVFTGTFDEVRGEMQRLAQEAK